MAFTLSRRIGSRLPSRLEFFRRKAFVTVVSSKASVQNLTEKIVQRYAVGVSSEKAVRAGDYVSIRPHCCMTHDNSWPVAMKFISIGAERILEPLQVVMTLDHDVQNHSEENLRKYRNIEEFAKGQGVDFYGAGKGIGHQIMVEKGYALPGTMTVASDSHTNMYGGVGCLGTPVVRTDAAAIWATGQTWWQIPPVAKVTFTGKLPQGVTGKDVILALCGIFNADQVLNHAIEFTGAADTMLTIPVDDRLAIANMTTEWGALSGLFPVDSLTRSWIREKASALVQPALDSEMPRNGLAVGSLSAHYNNIQSKEGSEPRNTGSPRRRLTHKVIDEMLVNTSFQAHPDASYAKEITLNLSTLSPFVAGPNAVKIGRPLSELVPENIGIQKAYLLSCTNSRASDLAAAAAVVRSMGNAPARVAAGVEFYIAAASQAEQEIAERKGDWQTLLGIGAKPLPSGCGPCIGLGMGLLEDGEVGISATNRNFKGRMGSREAFAYLASPEVVVASAIAGKISDPGNYKGSNSSVEASLQVRGQDLKSGQTESDSSSDQSRSTAIVPGFPSKISGEIVFCDADNLNTDGIYPGTYTYKDNISREDMAKVCMENYDSDFVSLTKPGDILVSGFNFGCGSSREQAATAILARGIPVVVAGTFGNIYQRNSINNALLVVEIPELVERLRAVFKAHDTLPTRRTGWHFEWDFENSTVHIKEEGEGGGVEARCWSKRVPELPPNVQDIFAKGGLEGWIKSIINLPPTSNAPKRLT